MHVVSIERRDSSGPLTLLLSSRPERLPGSPWTVAGAVAAAHLLLLALLAWLPGAPTVSAPSGGVDAIILSLPTERFSPPAGLPPPEAAPRPGDGARAAPAPPHSHAGTSLRLPPPPKLDLPAPTPALPRVADEPTVPADLPVVSAATPATSAATPAGAETPADSAGTPGESAATPASAEDASALFMDSLALAPRFTPFTRAPELENREQIESYLHARYPEGLQAMGVGGTTVLWLLLDPRGHIRKVVLLRSSGRRVFDDLAFEATDHMEFSPAWNDGSPVPVWVQIPVTFRVD